jgi:hypothetical protein
MQEAEGNMRLGPTDRSRSPRDESPKVRRKKNDLRTKINEQIQGEKGITAYTSNETGSTLNKNAMHNITASAEAGGKAENHRQKEKLSFTE